MSENANVIIRISANTVYPELSTNSTISPNLKMTKDELNAYVEKMTQSLQKNEAPVSLCASMVRFEHTTNPAFSVVGKPSKADVLYWNPVPCSVDDKLTIEIILKPHCFCGCADCGRSLLMGYCIDPFVEKLGMKFFPASYIDKIQRQRGV